MTMPSWAEGWERQKQNWNLRDSSTDALNRKLFGTRNVESSNIPMSYNDFLTLTAAQQKDILSNPSGEGLPEVFGGYAWRWTFTPESGGMWNLYNKQEEAETEMQSWLDKQGLMQEDPELEYRKELLKLQWAEFEASKNQPQQAMQPPSRDEWMSWIADETSGLASREWVKRWKLEQARYPFEVSPQEASWMAQEELASMQPALERQNRLNQMPQSDSWSNYQDVIPGMYDQAARAALVGDASGSNDLIKRANLLQKTVTEQRKYAAQLAESGDYPVTPKSPMIPEDVAKLTATSGRVPEQRREFVTPSAQKWQRAPYTTRQMAMGLWDVASKRSTQDILEHMYSMLPGEPSRATGWKPAVQRV